MRAWVSLSIEDLAALSPRDVAAQLAYAQAARHGTLELAQRHAWEAEAVLLRGALRGADTSWRVLFECDLLRLQKRLDAVVVTDRAIFVLEFKHGARTFEAQALRQAEDYALDLYDFHAGSRAHPVVPILVATEAPPASFDPPLFWHAVSPVLRSNNAQLGTLIAAVQSGIGLPGKALNATAWEAAPYRPVPTVLEAATLLYRRNSVAEIAAARADAPNLTRTAAAIERVIARARSESLNVVVFVTGIPGAGKTLCGLNVVFGALRSHGAAFLSGNVPLVTVLREALARDAAPSGGRMLTQARRKAQTALQNVHRFLEHYVVHGDHVPEARVIVFDEAQRAWNEAQATRNTQRRVSRLSMSEPGHALEIMGRHEEWSVIVALIGGGQEINTGEAGLAEWGRVIEANARWRAIAAPRTIAGDDPTQRLADSRPGWLEFDPDLDLTLPIRSVRGAAASPWVDAVLRGEAGEAAAIAAEAGGVPFVVARDLDALRDGLRRLGRGLRRAGLVASAGARRLRAEGLGVQVPEVADWFLNRWPDIRSSEALETFATEYDCQGLELDVVGLAWGGDFVRAAEGWRPRRFAGDRWLNVRSAEERRFILNTYRVLLTRSRYETVLWVPRGSIVGGSFHDTTRDAGEMDAIADFLIACGAGTLEAAPVVPARAVAQALL